VRPAGRPGGEGLHVGAGRADTALCLWLSEERGPCPQWRELCPAMSSDS